MIECHLLKKINVINKIVPDFMDTLYNKQVVYLVYLASYAPEYALNGIIFLKINNIRPLLLQLLI